ncbi:MAG: phosphopantothenoylcysteine decarboxylase [Planctomycetota bacterium JB042]
MLVTSGPTREPVDDVRYVSNVSTGSLGTAIAEAFLAAGHEVVLCHGAGSKRPPESDRLTLVEFTSARSLLEALRAETAGEGAGPRPDLLIHAAAVADYAPVFRAGKIKSTEPELTLRMTPTPKVVDRLRETAPDLPIVVFKLESGVAREELRARARRTMERVGAIAVVANLVEEVGPRGHRADLLRADGTVVEWQGREEISRGLVEEAERAVATRRTGS